MTYEYYCDDCKVTFEKFFSGFAAAEKFIEAAECTVCKQLSNRVMSAPLGFGLYGNPEGYDKPSPTKRFNTKTVSQITGNKNAVG